MNFVSLLHYAKRKADENTTQQQNGKFYSTKYSPPKKVCRERKHLSKNIQKFLEKAKEEEAEKERRKQNPKVAEALAKPEEQSNNNVGKVRKLNKKSAKKGKPNGSAWHDTGEGQGDDYGYTSSEANALYEKYLEKVQHVQEKKSFAPSRRQMPGEIFTTIERVKAAIDRDLQQPVSSTRPSRSRTRNNVGSSAKRSRSTSGAGTSKRMDPNNNFKRPESPSAKAANSNSKRRSRSFSRAHNPSATTEPPSGGDNDKKIRSSSCAGTSIRMDPSNTFKLPAAPPAKASNSSSKRRSRSFSRTHKPSANAQLSTSCNDNSCAGTSNLMDPSNTFKLPESPAKVSNSSSKRRSRSFYRTRKPSVNTKLSTGTNPSATTNVPSSNNDIQGTSKGMKPSNTFKLPKSPPAKAANSNSNPKPRSFSLTRNQTATTKLSTSSNGKNKPGTSVETKTVEKVKKPNSSGTNSKKQKKKGAVAEVPPKDRPAASGSGSLPKKRKYPPEDAQKQANKKSNNKRRRNATDAPEN